MLKEAAKTFDLKDDIHALTDFKRRTPEFLSSLRRTGRPIVLTVNGRSEVVVQDASAYQALLDRLQKLQGEKADTPRAHSQAAGHQK